MFRLVLFTILLSIPSIVSAQQPTNCPTLGIIGPPKIIGKPEVAKVETDLRADGLKYEWKVSEGEIIEGQGTATIQVATEKMEFEPFAEGRNITVDLRVHGLPAGCPSTTTHRFAVMLPAGHPYQLDEYSDLSVNDEKARLENLILFIRKEKGTQQAYIVQHTNPGPISKRLKQQIAREQHFLFVTRKQPKHLYTILVVPDGGSVTRLWPWPTNPKADRFGELTMPGVRVIPN